MAEFPFLDKLEEDSSIYCSHQGTNFLAKILKVTGEKEEKIFKIHYQGWSSKYDEEIKYEECKSRLTQCPVPQSPIEFSESDDCNGGVSDYSSANEEVELELGFIFEAVEELRVIRNKKKKTNDGENSEKKEDLIKNDEGQNMIKTQIWKNKHIWILPEPAEDDNEELEDPFDFDSMDGDDKSILNEIEALENQATYFNTSEDLQETYNCPCCLKIQHQNTTSGLSYKDRIETSNLFLSVETKKCLPNSRNLLRSGYIAKLPCQYSIRQIFLDFFNTEILEKIKINLPICPLYKLITTNLKELWLKLIRLRIMFDSALPHTLLYRTEKVQISNIFDGEDTIKCDLERGTIQYSRYYGYLHLIRFLVTLQRRLCSMNVSKELLTFFVIIVDKLMHFLKINQHIYYDNQTYFVLNNVETIREVEESQRNDNYLH